MADPDLDLLYCTHADGKLSIWKRKEWVSTSCSYFTIIIIEEKYLNWLNGGPKLWILYYMLEYSCRTSSLVIQEREKNS
jgi:hypothetical protein